ncbi:MAG: hypothetical protein QXR58_03165, partial [Candidatus Micrarchaeaceae archaeon]
SYIEPLIFLFSFGGILWIFYISVAVIFRHRYNEIAFGALALWIIFIIGLLGLHSLLSPQPYLLSKVNASATFSLFISMVSLITIFGIVGVAMLFDSSRAFAKEFQYIMKIMESQQQKKGRSR